MTKELRAKRHLSQRDLAHHLGIAPGTLSRYESGQRRWPPDLYRRACKYLGLGNDQFSQYYWSWKRHRAEWNWRSNEVEVDPGQTWATLPEGYEWFYQERKFKNQPPEEIKRLLRSDSALEMIPYAELYHDGAGTVFASITALNPPPLFLMKESGAPLGLARRAAIHYDGWLLFPQVNVLLGNRRIRVDMLAFRKGVWVVIEFHGSIHLQLSEYDRRRHEKLKVPVEHFTEAEILSGHFTSIFRDRMARYRRTRVRNGQSQPNSQPNLPKTAG